MKCPLDGAELRMMERQGVEIDYCPQCRGVWLDRGELDKLIKRAAASEHYDDDDRYEKERRDHPEHSHRRKKKSFWGEIFDFD